MFIAKSVLKNAKTNGAINVHVDNLVVNKVFILLL